MKIYDITRTLSASVAVWPGDQPFNARWTARIDEGSSVNLGAFEMSMHVGTHVDAPLHYEKGGTPVDRYELDVFLGPAFVVDVGDDDSIGIRHVDGLDFTGVPRVLFKTRASRLGDDVFDPNYAHIEPDVIAWLGQRDVVLVGTDGHSVDPFDSTELPTHHALARYDIANLENLYLRNVADGLYRLIALPLKLAGWDGAPVRAILTPAERDDYPGASH